MPRRAPLLVLALLSLLTLARPAACQNADFKPIFSGNSVPLSLTLKDMDGTWRRMFLSTSSGTADPLQAYLTLMTSLSSTVGNTYYTKGETVTAAGETYLVAYHLPVKINSTEIKSLLQYGPDFPDPPHLTPDTLVSLALLNVHTLMGMSDIQPFSLDKEMGESAAASHPDPEQASNANLKQIGLAVQQYTQDYDEMLPPMKSTAVAKQALYSYVKNDLVFQQPQTHEPYLPNTSLSHRTLASFDSPATMVIYYEASPAPDNTRAVLFLDGHVKRIPEAEWPALKAASHVPKTP